MPITAPGCVIVDETAGMSSPINPRDAEIEHADEQPHAALVKKEDIVRFDIAVDDALLVGVHEGQEQLRTELQRGGVGQSTLVPQPLAQRLPPKVLHHEERAVTRIEPEIVHDDDVRIGELAGDPCLALKSHVEFRIGAQAGVDQFDRDFALERRVHGPEDLSHAAAAAEFEDAVAAADQGRQRDCRHGLERRRAGRALMAVSVKGVPSSGQNRTSGPKGLPQVGQAGTREVSEAGIALPLRFHYFTVPSGGSEQESTVNANLATNCRLKRQPLARCAWVQTWREVLFAHWAVPEEAVRPHIDRRIEIDTWRGMAWISAVAFRLNTRPAGWPSAPFCSNFLELNLRTYVRDGDDPAVWFLSMHGGRRLAVWLGQRLTPLPYRFALMREAPRG